MKTKSNLSEYAQLKTKLYVRLIGIAFTAFCVIFVFYLLVWHNRGGDLLVSALVRVFDMRYEDAYRIYQHWFRNCTDVIWIGAVTVVFFVLLRSVLGWFTKYFDMINRGIDALLSDEKIELPPEMSAAERKLTAVQSELKQRALAAELANRRKNELVMYLAHDIRTPLTSVIGYLSLMAEAPDMPAEQRAKYVNITLEKANRLENMINEFFEITRYNMQSISVSKEITDLYYMLVQISDELSPALSENGNTVIIKADENITVFGDPDKLARVFNNVLKNAAAYSYKDTEIVISAFETGSQTVISFENKGKTIPEDKLPALFEKFYRLDDARASDTGGAGLGLAIAKEIVTLHGGTVSARSSGDTIVITIALPKKC